MAASASSVWWDRVTPCRARQRSSTAPSLRGCVPHGEKIAQKEKEADDLRAPSKKRDWRTKRRFDHEESPADDEIVIACVSVTDGFRGVLVIHRSRRSCV